MKLLEFYAANLNTGGAVTVASSLLQELALILPQVHYEFDYSFVLSHAVAASVGRETLGALSSLGRVKVKSQRAGFRIQSTQGSDLTYVVFGPEFGVSGQGRSVCGFADRSLIAEPAEMRIDSRIAEVRRKIKLQRMNSYAAYVVQTESASRELRQILSTDRPIAVIPNAVGATFLTPSDWDEVDLPAWPPNSLVLFYPASSYPHKNHALLARIGPMVERSLGRPVRFITTLDTAGFRSLGLDSSPHILNVGPLTASQCAWILGRQEVLALVFPSLLETFSSAPLEAMALRKPVIANDLPSLRETCGDNLFYFNVQEPQSFVNQLRKILADGVSTQRMIDRAHEAYSALPTPRERAERTLLFLKEVCET